MTTSIKDILEGKRYNVSVDKEIINNVNVEELLRQIEDAVDKPKAIGELLANELGAPGNVKFYIKLSYQYPLHTLFEALALTKEAAREGKITKDRPRYFYGIVRRQKMKEGQA